MNLTQRNKQAYWIDLERQLEAIFMEIVYDPIVDVIGEWTQQFKVKQWSDLLVNADDKIVTQALRSGRIQYDDGVFSGRFSAAISKQLIAMGARFDSRAGVYRLNQIDVPVWIRAEAAAYGVKAKAAHEKIKETLRHVKTSIDTAVDKHLVKPASSLARMEKDFAPIARQLEIAPQLTAESRQRIADSFAQDTALYVAEHCEAIVEDLFKAVQQNADQGYRFDRLARIIRSRADISKNKAKFLARQQSATYMARYRRERFGEAGVQAYEWSTSGDERVRETHKHLDGKVFMYDQPPIVSADGRRANPGEDYNCRCTDRPVLKPLAQEVAA